MIQMERVRVAYPSGMEALKSVSISVEKGEFLFVVGSSGSGKSTLIKTLLGEVGVSSGQIMVAGRELSRLKKKELPYYRRMLGVVFQEFRLLEDRNIFENVALSQRIIGVSHDRVKRNVSLMLDMVGLGEKRRAYPKELSGGEQQRVAIARAMVNRPAILLADEPTGNLDPKNSWEIMDLLEEMNQLGTTVVMVTHNNEIVNQMKKRVVTLSQGVVTNDMPQGGYVQ
ncbi:cell division ATP-binding protein FtsE [bacterium D16-51]|nr:cell division ATP-binding protein FtsE [bacterium D16-59]RKI61370.1 cell division ATP-binding protein FtsE [bacterium D16-51]